MHENIICHLRARARLIFFAGFAPKFRASAFLSNTITIIMTSLFITHLMTSHGTSGMYCTTTIKNTRKRVSFPSNNAAKVQKTRLKPIISLPVGTAYSCNYYAYRAGPVHVYACAYRSGSRNKMTLRHFGLPVVLRRTRNCFLQGPIAISRESPQ